MKKLLNIETKIEFKVSEILKPSLFVYVLIAIPFFGYSQRPLPIYQLQPIIDSIAHEVNILYGLSESEKQSLSSLELDYFKINPLTHLSYIENDTIRFLHLNSQVVTSEFNYDFKSLKLLSKINITRELTEKETKLFQFKSNVLSQVGRELEKITEDKESTTKHFFFENNKGYSFYIINEPIIDSVLTFGNDYLFLFDSELNLLSSEVMDKSRRISVKRIDNLQKQTLLSLSLPGKPRTNDFRMLVSRFYLFRKYHYKIGLSELGSHINKRKIVYDAIDNKITIQLFPIERN